MKKNLSLLLAMILIATTLVLAACGGTPTEEAPAATEAPATEAPVAGPADINGTKVCYLLPTLANPFLNNLGTTVKDMAAADGVEVFVYGAEEGGATAQYSQIENCISMGVKAMIVMAPGSIENVLPAVEEAQKPASR